MDLSLSTCLDVTGSSLCSNGHLAGVCTAQPWDYWTWIGRWHDSQIGHHNCYHRGPLQLFPNWWLVKSLTYIVLSSRGSILMLCRGCFVFKQQASPVAFLVKVVQSIFFQRALQSNDMLDHYAGHIWELELLELSLAFSLAPQCMLMFTWRRQHLKARMIMMMQWIHTFFWMKPFLSLDWSLSLHFALLSSSASTVWEYQLPPSFTFSIVLLVMKTGRSFADILTTYNLAQG